MAHYSKTFKRKMVQRLSGPGAPSALALSVETGVSQPTLSRWLREASSVRTVMPAKPVSSPEISPPTTVSPATPRRPEDWSAEEKLRAGAADDAIAQTGDVGRGAQRCFNAP